MTSHLKWVNYFCFLGFPAVLVAISLGVTQAVGYGSSKACWLDVESGLVWAFIGPAVLIILVSGYSLILCFIHINAKIRSTGCSDRRELVSSVFSAVKSKMEKNQSWMFGWRVSGKTLRERVSLWFLWSMKLMVKFIQSILIFFHPQPYPFVLDYHR